MDSDKFTIHIWPEYQQEPLKVLMCLTPIMADTMRSHLEIEFLQAEKKLLPDGRTEFIFEVTNQDRILFIKTFALELMKVDKPAATDGLNN